MGSDSQTQKKLQLDRICEILERKQESSLNIERRCIKKCIEVIWYKEHDLKWVNGYMQKWNR